MEFSKLHPTVNFIYFTAVIYFSVFLTHPVILSVSLVAAFICSLISQGAKKTLAGLALILPTAIAAAVLNVMFNHRGVTVIAYLSGGNAVTLEALMFSFAAAAMIAAVLWWFGTLGKVMTSDKVMYLFGKILPSLSLAFSMLLSLFPKLKNRFSEVKNAQQALGRNTNSVKGVAEVLSAVVTHMLESTQDTADSMKARGYGRGKRTNYSNFIPSVRDYISGAYLLILWGYLLSNTTLLKYEFYPQM